MLYKVVKKGVITLHHFAILRLLIAGLLLYFAWPLIALSTFSETLFWGVWLSFFWLVVGANFATVLTITKPPIMEQEQMRQR